MSSLSIGIVGLPNVGKSTLFNALTDNNILAANYPFATIEPNTGIVPIPDPRLKELASLYGFPRNTRLDGVQDTDEQRMELYQKYGEEAAQSVTRQSDKSTSGVFGSAGQQAGAARGSGPKIVPATVQFVDIAGLVAGASIGEGLGNQFLAHIRTCNAIVQVVRAFEDPNVQAYSAEVASATKAGHVNQSVGQWNDPRKDIEVINTELVLADLQTVEKRLPKLQKEAKANPKLKLIAEMLEQVKLILDNGTPLFAEDERWKMEDGEWLRRELQLLTLKPVIYVFNVDEETLGNDKRKTELAQLVMPSRALFVCAKLESELRVLDATDRQELLQSYGQNESGLIQLVHATYDILGLQSFLTAGEKEVRAWTIPRGATAPQAAGVIHGDFERGFIAAEVISYKDLMQAGSLQAAKAAGKVRTEGKTYVMQPDDVAEFRFNV